MGYRDDLIQRMRQDGEWNQLTRDAQAQVQRYTDEQARSFMVLWDEWHMRDPEAQRKVGKAALYDLVGLFKMNLVQTASVDKPRLSRAGRLLADLVSELQSRGLTLTEIESGFKSLHLFAIATLIGFSRSDTT